MSLLPGDTTPGNIEALAIDADTGLLVAKMMATHYMSHEEKEIFVLFTDLAERFERLKDDAYKTLEIYRQQAQGEQP
ncbi:hypothetical protein [Marinobacterium aestuariivivens]|uniref:Uncharacterized protein n=1 Tax=Marinobacterium aestuariivivens TaxID=1698799 RepID=A0ABW2A504_9GAMM